MSNTKRTGQTALYACLRRDGEVQGESNFTNDVRKYYV